MAIATSLLAVDPEVLTVAATDGTLCGIDVRSPVLVPILVLAAGVAPAFDEKHATRLRATHPAVEILRLANASHDLHDEVAQRPAYVSILGEFLRRHTR
jgi:hypothetical protein